MKTVCEVTPANCYTARCFALFIYFCSSPDPATVNCTVSIRHQYSSGSTMATTLRLRSALRLPWYVVLLVATYCLLHLGLVVEHPCATQGSNPD